MWFFLVAYFSTHWLFCHFTLTHSHLSRFPLPVNCPSVPLCSLRHAALINSLCIYNPGSPCLSCQTITCYLYVEPSVQTRINPKQNKNASYKHPNQTKKAQEGWDKPFRMPVTRQIDYWFLSGCVPSAHALMLATCASPLSKYDSVPAELSLCGRSLFLICHTVPIRRLAHVNTVLY